MARINKQLTKKKFTLKKRLLPFSLGLPIFAIILILIPIILIVSFLFSISPYREYPFYKIFPFNILTPPYDSYGNPTGMISKEWILSRPEAHIVPPYTKAGTPSAIEERFDPGDLIENPPQDRPAEVDNSYESSLSSDQIISWYRQYFISRGGFHEGAGTVMGYETRADFFYWTGGTYFVGIEKEDLVTKLTYYHTRFTIDPYVGDKPNARTILCTSENIDMVTHKCTEAGWPGGRDVLPREYITISDFNKKGPHIIVITSLDEGHKDLVGVTKI